jgi:hypothetical protein
VLYSKAMTKEYNRITSLRKILRAKFCIECLTLNRAKINNMRELRLVIYNVQGAQNRM